MDEQKIQIKIPELSLIVLVGSTGSGKSHFCQSHFMPTQVISSDFCRGIACDDVNEQASTQDAFDILHYIVNKRLNAKKLTVIDATNLRKEDREQLLALARSNHVLPAAIVFNTSQKVCWERTKNRPDRDLSRRVIEAHSKLLRRALVDIKREGFTGGLYALNSEEEANSAEIVLTPLYNNKQDEKGPFDIIGDIHGCYDELVELMGMLGYSKADGLYKHPEGRKLVFLGDLVDRGPKIMDTVNLVMDLVENGLAYIVKGNHDKKFEKYIRDGNAQNLHGLQQTVSQFEALTMEQRGLFRERYVNFTRHAISHFIFDYGNLAVAHAGINEYFQGRASAAVVDFCLYGDTTGEVDGYGLPVRLDWAQDYRGRALVVYGHTPVETAEFVNNTINIDQGCVFGGALTALRYPEREIVSVEAHAQYYIPAKPFSPKAEQKESSTLTRQQRHDRYLDIGEFIGKKMIRVQNRGSITVYPEQMKAALEVVSRFCVDHRWLVYLPPTMSPCETSSLPEFLEHPAEAFGFFRKRGIPKVVCEEKHMGSRAILILCRDEKACLNRFGIEGIGQCYTRTGRRFFRDETLHNTVIRRLSKSLSDSGWWEKFNTDWAVFDCEIIPWNLKAEELVINQYELVATAGRNTLQKMLDNLQATTGRNAGLKRHVDLIAQQLKDIAAYQKAYQNYCWDVASIEDIKIAPFFLLAAEEKVYMDKNHLWHMEELGKLSACDMMWKATPFMEIDTVDEDSCKKGIDWWLEITGKGAEGMVVKPLDPLAYSKGRLVQPALKCRGREYLRIIYGPSYDMPVNLSRLKNRGLAKKRSLAEREFLLGIEGLMRFVNNEPLRRAHECALGVLAMESETVDPRL